MPLRAWYPLNGNANNMGASNLTLTQTTAPTWTTGKTAAQSLNAGAYQWTAAQTATILNNNAFSYAAWIYVGDADTRSMIFGTDTTPRRFCLFQYPTKNDFHYSWYQTDSGSVFSGIVTGALPTGKWTHVAAVYQKGHAWFYINGVLKASGTPSCSITSYSAVTNVIHNNSNHRLQDVRVYDHALSQKEVAELAKGMMIHYTLDNPYTTGVLNFYSGTQAHGGSPSYNTNWTVTKLSDEDGYNFSGSRTGTGGNSWPNFGYASVSRSSFVAGRKYTWSAQIRCNVWSSGTLTLRNSIGSNDYTNGGVDVCSPTRADGQWHQYTRTITITEGMKIGSTFYYLTDAAYNASTESSKAYMSPRVEFYCSNQNGSGTVYNMDFDIKEVQLIESDSFPGWVDNTMASNTVRDNTGRGNDATCNGTITTAAGSPRNFRAYQFVSGSSLWPITDPIKSTTTEFTISVWFKTTSLSSDQCIWNGRTNAGSAVAIFVSSKNLYVDDSNRTTISNVITAANTWYHIAVTWKSGGSKVTYLNGTQISSVAVGTLNKSNTKASIGRSSNNDSLASSNYFSGQMSDFRIYATALTADQVKELYSAPISVANTGACLSGQFTEGASGIAFAKTGVVSGTAVSELPGKYDAKVLIEPDGSCWARIGHHADPTTYKFASSDPFDTGVWKDDRRFLDPSFCDNVDKWEFIAKQKTGASAAVQTFRWVQAKNPNTAVYADVTAANVTKYTSSQGYDNLGSSYGGIYKFNSNTYYVMNNGSNGNWFGAIGCWTSWSSGIPGINGVAVADGGFLDLYIRIDNVTFTNGRTGCSLDKGGKAVLGTGLVEQ